MASKIQLRRGLAASWTTLNPILSAGEPGVETDTGKLKIGDGSTAWADLDYLAGEAEEGGSGIPEGGITNAHVASAAAISADKLADGGTNKVFTAAEQLKLSQIEPLATLNSTDTFLRARSNHTGTQAQSTIIGLEEALESTATDSDITAAVGVAVAETPIYKFHSGIGTALSGYPVRPATSRPVEWFGPAAAALPTNGTVAGGTRAAVSGLDIINEY
jgi:hypothetical protein